MASLKTLAGTSSNLTTPVLTVTALGGIAVNSIKFSIGDDADVMVEVGGVKKYLCISTPTSTYTPPEVLTGTLNLPTNAKLYCKGTYFVSYVEYPYA